MRRKKINLLVLICSILFSLCVGLCGCGKRVVEEQLPEKPKKELKQVEILTKEWKSFSEVEEENSWVVTGFEDDLCKMGDMEYHEIGGYTKSQGSKFFCLREFCNYETMKFEALGLWEKDLENQTEEMISFTFHDLKYGPEIDGTVCDDLANRMDYLQLKIFPFDVVGDRIQIFAAYGFKEDETHMYWLEIDQDLKLYKMVELSDSVLAGLQNEEGVGYEFTIVCNEQGDCYFVNYDCMEITIVNSEGQVIDKVVMPEGKERQLLYAGKVEGIPVFCRSIDKKITFFTLENGGEKCVYEGDFVNMEMCSLDEYGNLLYLDRNIVYRWNLLQGSREKIYNISNFQWLWSASEIIGNGKNDIFIFGLTHPGYQMYRLSENADFETVEITLLQAYQNQYLETCAKKYTNSHPGVSVSVKTMKNGNDEYEFQRLLEDMKNGSGPDLLYLSWEKMEMLKRAGCLQPIDGMITEEIRQNVFPGVLECGIIDGELYGAVFEATPVTLYVKDTIWPSDHWSLQEFMNCFNNAKKNGNTKWVERGGYQSDGADLFGSLSRAGMDNLNFIDLENKKSFFISNLFLEYMQFCHENEEIKNKKNGTHISEEEGASQFQSGESFTYMVYGNMISFSRKLAGLGFESHSVGFPDNKGMGVYLECYSGTAVSKWTNHLEVVADFIQYMYSEKIQANNSLAWVRRDCLEKRMKNATSITEEPHFRRDDSIIPMQGKQDGTSFVKEYIELMDKAKPEGRESAVKKIIWEEIPAYYNGDKSAKEVAGILHSRVQLYLDEQ